MRTKNPPDRSGGFLHFRPSPLSLLRLGIVGEDVLVVVLGHEDHADHKGAERDDDRIPQAVIDIPVCAIIAKDVAGMRPPNQPLPM